MFVCICTCTCVYWSGLREITWRTTYAGYLHATPIWLSWNYFCKFSNMHPFKRKRLIPFTFLVLKFWLATYDQNVVEVRLCVLQEQILTSVLFSLLLFTLRMRATTFNGIQVTHREVCIEELRCIASYSDQLVAYEYVSARSWSSCLHNGQFHWAHYWTLWARSSKIGHAKILSLHSLYEIIVVSWF